MCMCSWVRAGVGGCVGAHMRVCGHACVHLCVCACVCMHACVRMTVYTHNVLVKTLELEKPGYVQFTLH